MSEEADVNPATTTVAFVLPAVICAGILAVTIAIGWPWWLGLIIAIVAFPIVGLSLSLADGLRRTAGYTRRR